MLLFTALMASTCSLPRLDITRIHPTQFAVGMREVQLKEQELSAKKPKKLEKFLCERAIPVVKGPRGEYFATDHHHFARALWDRGEEEVFIEVGNDWSSLSETAFWSRMRNAGLMYLMDEQGRHRQASELPDTLGEMKDDEYRSLSYFVQRTGAFEEVEVPYSEFTWAEFFRSRIFF